MSHGYMDTWVHGCMDTWIHGYMDTWIHGYMDFPAYVYYKLVPIETVYKKICYKTLL